MSTGHGENKMPRLEEDPAEESDGYTPSIADTVKDDVDIDRMINDPEYMPFFFTELRSPISTSSVLGGTSPP